MKRLAFVLFFLLSSLAPIQAEGDAPIATPPVDKSQYNLFHPVPDNLLRSFSADRPSQSTGPYTVDAGHFYFETSVISSLYDEPDSQATVRQFNVLPFNFRMGLTSNIELDIAYANYLNVRTHDRATGQTDERDGLGDLILQGKINLVGNDGGKVAFGLIPFLKVPTNTHDLGNDSVEGGLGLPLQFALPAGFSLGLEPIFQFVRNGTDDGYVPAFTNALIVGHTLFTDKLSTYAEFYDVVTDDSGSSHAAFIDTGFVYQILPNAEVDIGCNFGITDAAPDYQPFAGFSFRF